MGEKKNAKASKPESLLVELLTEELPPKSLRTLDEAFGDLVVAEIVRHRLKPRDPTRRTFATPRRLAVLITEVAEKGSDSEQEVQGPPSSNSKAVEGFAKKYHLTPESLERRRSEKGEVVVARFRMPGVRLDAVLAEIVQKAIEKLPVAKLMRWGSGEAQFVRPVHGLVMMHGNRVVRGTVLGVGSGNRTHGHRFMGKRDIVLKSAEEYEARLRDEGKVIADFAIRRDEIRKQLQASASKLKAQLGEYESLLDEVTALVEHPSVYVGRFDESFLEVPHECLTLSLRQHQRYFPLFDNAGRLLPKFLIVSNMKPSDPRHVIHGNERVVRPRMEDARFFYNQDRKTRLDARARELAKVVYHSRLGSQRDRVGRLKVLAGEIAQKLGPDRTLAERAAELCKADLLTGMVGEFPELQGVMGRYYALHDGEPREVAEAIEAHYRPRFSGDRLPEGPVACALALADKLDAIVGMFGAHEEPTGEKDPFALRRHGLGVVRILVERQLDLRLMELIDGAIEVQPSNAKSDWARVLDFVLDRARSYFAERGFSKRAIESVIQPFGAATPLCTVAEIVEEASRFAATEEGKILAQANKRITNILKKSGFDVPLGVRPEQLKAKPNPSLFREKAEEDFWNALQKIGGESVELRAQKKFAASLRALSRLGQPTKTFFDGVMVNVEEPDIRDNRITLLQHARAYMNQVAELSLTAL